MRSAVVEALSTLPAPAAYALVAAAILVESVLLLGAFVPSLTIMVTSGTLAALGQIELWALVLVAAASVVVGDFLGWRTGRHLGPRLRQGPLGRRIPDRSWHRAETQLCTRGGRAVFLARFVPVARTLVPHLAGALGTSYRRIVIPSIGASTTWAVLEAGAGFMGATSVLRHTSVTTPAIVAIVAIAIAIAVAGRRQRRAPGPDRATRPSRSRSCSADRASGTPAAGSAVEP